MNHLEMLSRLQVETLSKRATVRSANNYRAGGPRRWGTEMVPLP